MPINFKKLVFILFLLIPVNSYAQEIKSLGKYKDWESFRLKEGGAKTCFARSIPVLKAPKGFKRNPSRLFVSFRPKDNVKNEVSVTAGYIFDNKSLVTAKSGKNKFDLFSQGDFAWAGDVEDEKKIIKLMRSASRIMIIGKTINGKKTTDHYSLMGFTKAYNTAKKSCS